MSDRTFRFALRLPWLMAIAGCGVSGEASRSAPNTGDAAAESSTGQQVVIPAAGNSDASDTTDIDNVVGDLFADDPLDQPVIGPDEFANYLSFLNDAFVTELLRGTPSTGGFQSSETYLERLCIENGTPEFICRQRYGN